MPTYDLAPEMSARAVADLFLEAWREQRPRFAILNFANPDMVGHTGVIPAAVRAIETVDECLGEVVRAVLDAGGACVVTADHGNAEHMLEPDGCPNTAHSSNPVPLIAHPRRGLRLLAGRGASSPTSPPPSLAAARHPSARGDVRALADPRSQGDMMAHLERLRRVHHKKDSDGAGDGEPASGKSPGVGARGGCWVCSSSRLVSNHFVMPRAYRRIVPPGWGDPSTLVTVSGVAEVAGGLGMLSPGTRRLAGLGLIALLARGVPREPPHGPQSRTSSTASPAGRCTRACPCSR